MARGEGRGDRRCVVIFSDYKREPATESDEDRLDDLLTLDRTPGWAPWHPLALEILEANRVAVHEPDAWNDLIFSIPIEDDEHAVALLRAMPGRATSIGRLAAADRAGDLAEVARWAFAHFVCDAIRFERGGNEGRALFLTARCVTCGVPLTWEYPGAWVHEIEGDESGDRGVELDEQHYGRPGGSFPS